MKSLYTFGAIILLTSSSLYSQHNSRSKNIAVQQKNHVFFTENSQSSKSFDQFAKDFDDPIFESDFSDASDWLIGNEVGNDDNWVIGTSAPSGSFAIGAINSTTADNGFALFDSDALCSGNQDAWLQIAEPISLVGIGSVAIRFETYYREFEGSTFIETSVDGTIWTSTEILELGGNNFSENPRIFQLVLSELENVDEAFIRFRYTGGCDYAWMIDDVVVAATPEFDLILEGAYYDDYILVDDNGTDLDYFSSLEYSSYRVNHVRPFTFVADVNNFGFGDYSNVIFSVSVTTPNGVESYATDPIDFLAFEEMVITIDNIMLDAFDDGGILGDYELNFEISGDEEDVDGSNNIIAKTFSVNNEFMANDRGNTFQSTAQTAQDVIYGNQFTLVEDAQVNYISFGLNTSALFDGQPLIQTLPGEDLFLNIRQGSVFDDNVSTTRLFGDNEVSYVISADDLSADGVVNWITVMLPVPLMLSGDVVYQGEVQAIALEQNYMLMVLTQPQEGLAGSFRNNSNPNPNVVSGFYTPNGTPAIRVGFMDPDGLSDASPLKFTLGQNFPNPSNGTTTISWELLESADDIKFAIYDVNGKVVYRKNLGSRPAGIQEMLELNLSNLAAGSYQYAMQIDNNRLVRKMIIQ